MAEYTFPPSTAQLDASGSADDIPCRDLDPLQAILKAPRSDCGKGTCLLESESWAIYRQSVPIGMEQRCIDHPAKAIDMVDVVMGQEYAVQIGAPGSCLEHLLLPPLRSLMPFHSVPNHRSPFVLSQILTSLHRERTRPGDPL